MDINDFGQRSFVTHTKGLKERIEMTKFIFTASVEVEGEDEDDARIELLLKMDDHDIYWEIEEKEDE